MQGLDPRSWKQQRPDGAPGQDGDGWRAFRRIRTKDGRYSVGYRFSRTIHATTYIVRAQVRSNKDLPYLPGNSRWAYLRVLP